MGGTTERPTQNEGESHADFWKRKRTWEVESGEICPECGAFNLWAKGCRHVCYSCRAVLNNSAEVYHHCHIRCPKCRAVHDVTCGDFREIGEDGEHCVNCDGCGHEFTITTDVSYLFTSPALIPAEESRGEQDPEQERGTI